MIVSREDVENAIYNADIVSFNEMDDVLRTDYSGRGMYGDKCFGLVCSEGELLRFIVHLAQRGEDVNWIDSVRSDSMGRSTIWYWPQVQLSEE